jgi:alpha-mannosidase
MRKFSLPAPRARISLAFVCLFGASAIATFAQEKDAVPPAHKAVLEKLRTVSQIAAEEWRIHPGDIADGQTSRVDDSAWQVVKQGYTWTSGITWFRRVIEIPAGTSGYDFTGATLRLSFATQSDMDVPAIVYLNGSRIAMGVELEPIEFANEVRPGQKFLLAVKVICPQKKEVTFAGATISVAPSAARPSPRVVMQALEADEALEALFPATGEFDRARAAAAVDAAYNAVDFGALGRGDQSGFDASLNAAIGKLAALDPVLKKYSVRAVGNSHIDMAWLWPWSETSMVVHDTFSTALTLMNEYPDYFFTQSSAQTDAWLEEKYPDIFEEIKKRVAEGRWELVGGMWVEPDLNMPDGESQVRQLLLGTRYFKEKFGKQIRIGWNPDSFGYNWQLPQIYKKSGIDYFVTQKIGWNDTTQFPYKLFWWQSPDGSKVLTYFPHDYVNSMDPVRIAHDAADLFTRVPNLTEMMHLYGIGDHGGGPTRYMLDEGDRWMRPAQPFMQMHYGTAQGFFNEIEKEMPRLNLPTWNSELYLQYHRGVFTTQAETKRHNRESETLLLNAEKFASLAYLTGADYPSADLEYAWKKVLFNQFHDVAAGSGIPAIYRDADRDYAEVRRIGEGSITRSVEIISDLLDTRGPGVPILVLNPLSWERTDVVEAVVRVAPVLAKEYVESIRMQDSKGRPVPIEVAEYTPGPGTIRIRFLARDVPALGFEIFRAFAIRPYGVSLIPDTSLKSTETTIENSFLKLRVDAKTGCITSLVLKKDNFETLAPGSCGNLLQAFQDKPKDYDAWNIDADFEKVHWDIAETESVKLQEKGRLRSVIRVTKKWQNSTIFQDITLQAGIPRVDIVTDVDWHEKHVLLKAAFTLAAKSNKATFEIPFGSIERPTTRNTPEEQAMFEVPAIRWADISDGAHGFSLLNDCKYGYDAKDNVLRISLLRSPESPDPHADEGHHHFTYSLYPHDGDWKQAETIRRGYELNYNLLGTQLFAHDGTGVGDYSGNDKPLTQRQSLVGLSGPNVVLTAFKKAEGEDAIILRFYEWAGKESDVTIDLPFAPSKAYLANLMEQQGAELAVKGATLTVHTKPFEIQTVKLVFPSMKRDAVPTN